VSTIQQKPIGSIIFNHDGDAIDGVRYAIDRDDGTICLWQQCANAFLKIITYFGLRGFTDKGIIMEKMSAIVTDNIRPNYRPTTH
jgi:hypothetical protein